MARTESIKKLHQLLLTRRDAMRRALDGDLTLLKKLRERGGKDSVDDALDAAQDEINSQLAEVESRELGSIDNALLRIKQGFYGMCEVCGSKIPMARLNALPYATMCIECQQADENGTLEDRRNSDWSQVIDAGYADSKTSVADIDQ